MFFLLEIYTFLSFILSKFSFWFHEIIDIPILSSHSSYNLGTAITAIAIIVAFIEFISNKNELKFKLNYRNRKTARLLASGSIFLVFLGELNGFFLGYPFIFEVIGALLMISAIGVYLHLILTPINRLKLNQSQISILQEVLEGTLTNSHVEKSRTIEGCIGLFKNLLQLSLDNKEVQKIFERDFASDIFLKYFSESYFVFGNTIDFYIENKENGEYNLDHIEFFLKKLMAKSLENNDSVLNMFVEQEICPRVLFCLDEVMLKEKSQQILSMLFKKYRITGLSKTGQLNYISLVSRYFRLVRQENNHVSFEDNYQKTYDFNDELIIVFFQEIEKFFEQSYDKEHLKELLKKIEGFAGDYRWGLKTKDKSERIKKKTGDFLYNIFYHFIIRYEIENPEVFRLKVEELYRRFIEIQENGIEDNIAYNTFTEKLKDKILGLEKEKYAPNYKGYFSQMILIYFYIYGNNIFSKQGHEKQKEDLHVPILSKLAESFPRLYQGFKQRFYDNESLPDSKEDLLKKQGREILNKFLPEYITYNFEENSLSYHSSKGINSSKIFLDEVRDKQKIEVEKV